MELVVQLAYVVTALCEVAYLWLLSCWFRKRFCLICFAVLAVSLFVVCSYFYEPQGFKGWYDYTSTSLEIHTCLYFIFRWVGVKLP